MTVLDEFVAEWARRTPEQVAVASTEENVTYRDLDRQANRFAHALLTSGLRRGDRVGIHLEKSCIGVAAMLGVLRAGGVYVPIDPLSPPVRAALIANDCDIGHMLIAPALLAAWQAAGVSHSVEHFFLSEGPASTVTSDEWRAHPWSEVSRQHADPPAAVASQPNDLAYILYTSGSTGVPKGVMISFRNALAFVEWAGDLITLSAQDTIANHAPFHFDLSVFDIYASLRAGATVVLIDERAAASAGRMVDLIHQAGITVWYSVPSVLVLLLEKGRLEERGAPKLRAIFFAGEVFPVKYLRRLMLALPDARFFNLFGPTETNVCLYHEVCDPPGADAPPIPAGTPACGDEAFVLDRCGEPVRDGEVGELFIEGPTVMLGYWNGGRRTQAMHPYPTGDRVSRDSDGYLRYHGRRDHMIKIRGFRIELGEVETALLKHPGIRECVAMAVDNRLVAAVVARSELSVVAIKRSCAAMLPSYMVPHDIRLVLSLPKTSTGKTDRVLVKQSLTDGTLQSQVPTPAAFAK